MAGTVDPATLAPFGRGSVPRLRAGRPGRGAVDELYATVGTRLLAYRATDDAEVGTPAPDADVITEATPPDAATDEIGVAETEPTETAPAEIAETNETPATPGEGRCRSKSSWKERASVSTARCPSIRRAWSGWRR